MRKFKRKEEEKAEWDASPGRSILRKHVHDAHRQIEDLSISNVLNINMNHL